MSKKSFGVLCESESGVDEFGNATGDRILMESVGDMLELHDATERAKGLRESGRFGKVIVVSLAVHEVIF